MTKRIISFKQMSTLSPFMRLLYAILGLAVVIGVIITITTITNTTSVSEQYDAIAVWQNNGEGNWDIAYSIYKQNGDIWLHQVDKDIYYEGDANLIAKLPGDDNDPDISSARYKAMAVWSNTGMSGNKRADIVLSKWDSNGWTEPTQLFTLAGDDVDPTVYMQDPENALVVWVNRNGDSRTLYYSRYSNGGWSNPEKIPFNSASKIATPELGYITTSSSRYLLVFTARVAGVSSAYTGTYDRVNGWDITKIGNKGTQAMTDESIPAKYRTSASMQIDSHDVAISWTGQDKSVWYVKASPANPSFEPKKAQGGGVNPVVMYDPEGSTDADTMIISSSNDIVDVTPIGGDLKQTVSSEEAGYTRADATYLWEQGKRAAVAVWATQQENPSEIYFSALGKSSQKWSSPDRIDGQIFPGEDLNPAITSIIIQFTKEHTLIENEDYYVENQANSFCGDGILDKGFLRSESCEIGIACGNPDQICDWDYYTKKFGKFWAGAFSDCECLIPDDGDALPPTKPKTTKKEEKKAPKKSDVAYGGASCGFGTVKLKSAIGTGEVKLQFLPEAHPANNTVTFLGGYPTYQAEQMRLFPLAGDAPESYFVMVAFSGKDDNTITMTGIDTATGFQLCTGTFTKGAPDGSGPFVPASATGADVDVPSLPGN